MPRSRAWVMIAILGFSTQPARATPFVPEIVSSGYNAIGRFNSLALDGQGNPRISFYDGTFGTLQYASRSSSGTWTTETADAGSGHYVGLFSSLKLDALGNPRIAYYDSTGADLRYASKSGGVWTIETVDSPGDKGRFCSLALDPLGNPHISYYDASSGYLKYASKPSVGPWVIETADPDPSDYVGTNTSLAIDGSGRPHISYLDVTTQGVRYATQDAGGAWVHQQVEFIFNSVSSTSLALDSRGAPAIAYQNYAGPGNTYRIYASIVDGSWTTETMYINYISSGNLSLAFDGQWNPHALHTFAGALLYSSRSGGVWTTEVLEAPTLSSYVADFESFAMDAQGNPKGSYNASGANGLKLVDSSVRVVSPGGGVTWPVGALRSVDWRGTGPVAVSLSTDGGISYQTLLEGVGATPVSIRVPHTPTRFARVKVERGYPLSTAFSESTFTIQTSVALLALLAAPAPGGARGAVISWQTDPGPGDLAGYKLEKTSGSATDWRTLAELTRETSVTDPDGGPGTRYRLSAVNGFNDELWLGETALRPAAPLAAWPLPYRAGNLSIAFATYGGLGGGSGFARVSVFDVAGRLVRTVANGQYPAGYQSAIWDGRDTRSRIVAAGLYFLRAESAREKHTLKIVVTP